MDAYKDKIYLITNEDYEDKKVLASDALEAIQKYENYLREHINLDYSYMEIFGKVTSVIYVKDFEEDDLIK